MQSPHLADAPPAVERGDGIPPPLPDPSVLPRIYAIGDGLAAFEAARSADALQWLLGAVADLVDAQNAYWMGSVRVVV